MVNVADRLNRMSERERVMKEGDKLKRPEGHKEGPLR